MVIDNGKLLEANEFRNQQKIKIPKGVHTISERLLYGTSSLQKLIISDGVTTIENDAFANCPYLKKVVLPHTLQSLGERAFNLCNDLVSIEIPDGVTTIKNSTFGKCANLKSAILPSTLKKINEKAFHHCKKLKQIDFPSGLESLGEAAFEACENLTSITIPQKITEIPNQAFNCCVKLYEANLNDNIVSIGEESFDFCKFAFIDLPKNLVSIGTKAFANSALTEVVIPDSVKNLGYSVFCKCHNLTKITFPKNCEKIPDGTCSSCFKLQEIIFPENLKFIGNNSFSFSGLTQLIIPNGVISIGKDSFLNSTLLENVVLPQTLTEIGNQAFYACSKLTEIDLPSSIKILSEKVFAYCKNLKTVILHDGLEKIESSAFQDCSSLESITIPETVKTIGVNVFANCSRLQNVTLPNSLVTLDTNAFMNCFGIKQISLPQNLEVINSSAFAHCENLENIEIPKSVKTIGESAFSSCKSLKTIVLPNGISKIPDKAFQDCINLTYIKIPNSVKSIAKAAFQNCTSLKSITLPENLESIGDNAFENCTSLESISIPKTIKNLSALPSLMRNFKYIIQTEKGITMSKTPSENSYSIPAQEFNLKFIGKNWQDSNKIINESKNEYVRKFYNEFVAELDEEKAKQFIDNHNFTFFKQLKDFDPIGNYNYFKFLYNIGVFEPPIEEKGKTINYAQKITGFLIEKFQKREISTSALSTIFTNMEEQGFKKEFTEFLIKDFDELMEQEKRNPGFLSNCYNQFEEIQATNTSNKGSQRQLKPTVKKFVDYFNTDKFNGVNPSTQYIANAIAPYFSDQEEFDLAVKVMQEFENNHVPTRLLNERLVDPHSPFETIDEMSKNIQRLQGETLGNLANVAANEFTFDWLEKNDTTNLYLGKLCRSCAHLSGDGFSIMHASIVDPYVQNLVIRNHKNKIIAKSTLFINPKKGYGVFNSLELASLQPNDTSSMASDTIEQIYQKYMEAVRMFAEQYNREHPKQPIKQLNIGLGSLINIFLERHKRATKILDTPYKNYGNGNSSYAGNSNVSQFVLWTIDEKPQTFSNGSERT